MAQDLPASVELLSAAIEAVPSECLDRSDAEPMVVSFPSSVAPNPKSSQTRNLINSETTSIRWLGKNAGRPGEMAAGS
jgi:hypothetical protein